MREKQESRKALAGSIVLTPEEQRSFWNALNEKPKLTPAQRRLASVMRGGVAERDPPAR